MPPFVRHAAVLLACSLAGCRAPAHMDARPLTLAATMADSVVTEPVAPGARLHRLVNTTVPWRAFVLEARRGCVTFEAAKGGATAVGRTATSTLLAQRVRAETAFVTALAAVNADFFLPNGLPTNAHIEHGILFSGPDARPVLWTDASGRLHLDTLQARGHVKWRTQNTAKPVQRELSAWNRPSLRTSGVIDARWGAPLDSAVRARVVRLVPLSRERARAGPAVRGRFVVLPQGTSAAATPQTARGDTLLLLLAPAGVTHEPVPQGGDTVQLDMRITRAGATTARARVMHAVGGRPRLLVDSAVTADVDTEGNAGFRGLNPRTLLGFDRTGDRVWLVVADGRAPGYSMGMTLRQSADLLRALGAVHGLNLDGGGSSTLAVRNVTTGTVGTINRMSDGPERPVANALLAISHCRQR